MHPLDVTGPRNFIGWPQGRANLGATSQVVKRPQAFFTKDSGSRQDSVVFEVFQDGTYPDARPRTASSRIHPEEANESNAIKSKVFGLINEHSLKNVLDFKEELG